MNLFLSGEYIIFDSFYFLISWVLSGFNCCGAGMSFCPFFRLSLDRKNAPEDNCLSLGACCLIDLNNDIFINTGLFDWDFQSVKLCVVNGFSTFAVDSYFCFLSDSRKFYDICSF